MAKLKWLPEALADVERLHEFVKDIDTQAASQCVETILKGSRLLKATLHLGRPMSDGPGSRELFMQFGAGAYVLRYRLEDTDTVVIVRVWHSREDRK
jgi:plasmid stabilization system protein ParE